MVPAKIDSATVASAPGKVISRSASGRRGSPAQVSVGQPEFPGVEVQLPQQGAGR
jgi:hypothetical protein